MALNFPINPVYGQTYSNNGKDWIFNGIAWDAVNIQSAGPQGFQGSTGSQVSTGPQGLTGLHGSTGSQGSTGPQGSTGGQGSTGPQGNSGVQGETGPQGNTGSQGSTGNQGLSGPQGFTGDQGPTGPQGSAGQSSNYFKFFATASVSGNPGPSFISWNTVSQISATQINISHLDSSNSDIDVFLALIKTNDNLIIQDQDDSSSYQKFDVIGAPTIYTNSYVEVPVSFLTSSGTASINFSDGQHLSLFIFSKGVIGPQGLTGPPGFTGVQGPTGPQGSTGLTGPIGITGSDGANTVRLSFGASSSTAPGVTGSFNLVFGTVGGYSFSSVSALYYNSTPAFSSQAKDVYGNSIYNWLLNIYSDYNALKPIIAQISEVGNASNYGIYRITGAGAPTPYWIWSLSFVSGGGTLSSGLIYSISELSNGATGNQGPRGNTGSTGPQGSTGPAGSVGSPPDWYFNGAWAPNVIPALGDIYTYDGRTWYNDSGAATGTPSLANGWSLLADRGTTGSQGPTGPQGPAGTGGGGAGSTGITLLPTSILTDAATISISLTSSNSSVFTITLGGNRTLENPTDMPTGTDVKYFGIIVTQDSTGGRTLSYDTIYNTGDIDTDLNYGTASRTHLYFMASSGLVELIGKRT